MRTSHSAQSSLVAPNWEPIFPGEGEPFETALSEAEPPALAVRLVAGHSSEQVELEKQMEQNRLRLSSCAVEEEPTPGLDLSEERWQESGCKPQPALATRTDE